MTTLERELADGRHDLSTRPGLGHLAGRVKPSLAQHPALTIDVATRLLGVSPRHRPGPAVQFCPFRKLTLHTVAVLGDEFADADVLGLAVDPVAVQNLESVCAQVGFSVGFDLFACAVVSRPLGGMDELGRVGGGDVDEVGAGFVVFELDQGCGSWSRISWCVWMAVVAPVFSATARSFLTMFCLVPVRLAIAATLSPSKASC